MEEKPKKYNKDIKVRESRDMAWAHGRAPISFGALRRKDEPEGQWNSKGTAQTEDEVLQSGLGAKGDPAHDR